MQITGNRGTLDLLWSPAQLGGDDLAEFADADRVPLRVLVLAVDRGCERSHSVVIGRAHLLKELLILFRTTLDLGHQIPLSDRDTNVLAHRADDVLVVRRSTVRP